MKRELFAATALGSLMCSYGTSLRAQTFNWSGPYVGALAGYGTTGSHAVSVQPGGAPIYDLNFPANIPTFNPTSAPGALSVGPFSSLPFLALGANALLAGGTIGFNRQIDRFVFGLETDFVRFRTANTTGFNLSNVTINGARNTTGSVSIGTDWLYTLRGRVGYAFDRLLVFGTGGLALGQTRLNGNFGINENNFVAALGGFFPGKGTSTSASGSSFGSQNQARAGFTLGGGAEYAVTDHVTVKLEGLYYDLGAARATLAGYGASSTTVVFLGPTTTSGAFSIQPLTVRYHFDGALARAGVNYKF